MKLVEDIFGKDIMEAFKKKRPAGFVDLMIAFESRKRSCSPNKLTALNIALPFSFIDFYRRHKGKDVGMAINKYGDKGIKWVSHGMLRIEVSVMKKLFEHPVNKMIEVRLCFHSYSPIYLTRIMTNLQEYTHIHKTITKRVVVLKDHR